MAGDRVPVPVPGDHRAAGGAVGGDRRDREQPAARAGAGAAARALIFGALPAAADGSGYYRMYLPWKHLAANSRHLAMIPPPGHTPPMPTAADMEGVDTFVAQRPVGPVGMRTWDALEGVTA